MADYKYRFIKMMKKYAPMKKSELTRRALAQLRIDMSVYNGMLTRYTNQGLISCKKFPTPGLGGVVPIVYFLTAKGKAWIVSKNKEIRRMKAGLK